MYTTVVPPPPHNVTGPTTSAPFPQNRSVAAPQLETMGHDISLCNFTTWREQWQAYFRLEQLDVHPIPTQSAALKTTMSTQMLHTVEIAFGTWDEAVTTPDNILDAIYAHIRSNEA